MSMQCAWEFPVERIFDYINNCRKLNNSRLENYLQINNENKNKNFTMEYFFLSYFVLITHL